MTRKEYPVTDQINVCDKGSVTEGILLSVVKNIQVLISQAL